ncbi:hypothetical protein Pelo_6453 [Pelomyxa schiedti]|nr:hypothetical protein Pelo_8042 [Pelomyxa schiedti]KAH3761706.1 hypothetical protein Pelo_6453 [Pelomyxa schiedti]
MSCYPRVNSDCAIANRDLNGLGITLPPPPPLLTQQQVSRPAQQWQMPAPHSQQLQPQPQQLCHQTWVIACYGCGHPTELRVKKESSRGKGKGKDQTQNRQTGSVYDRLMCKCRCRGLFPDPCGACDDCRRLINAGDLCGCGCGGCDPADDGTCQGCSRQHCTVCQFCSCKCAAYPEATEKEWPASKAAELNRSLQFKLSKQGAKQDLAGLSENPELHNALAECVASNPLAMSALTESVQMNLRGRSGQCGQSTADFVSSLPKRVPPAVPVTDKNPAKRLCTDQAPPDPIKTTKVLIQKLRKIAGAENAVLFHAMFSVVHDYQRFIDQYDDAEVEEALKRDYPKAVKLIQEQLRQELLLDSGTAPSPQSS